MTDYPPCSSCADCGCGLKRLTCNKYQQWEAERARRKEIIKRNKMQENIIASYIWERKK